MRIEIRNATPEDVNLIERLDGGDCSLDGVVVIVDGTIVATVDEYGTVRWPNQKASESAEDRRARWIDQMVFAAGEMYTANR